MIDISKGRYWDLPWSLVDGCTPCSPGCDHCWSAVMTHRFTGKRFGMMDVLKNNRPINLTYSNGRFTGDIVTHPKRLSIPMKRKKPTVYAVWNDLFHKEVPVNFLEDALAVMTRCPQHTFLVLTKRAQRLNLMTADRLRISRTDTWPIQNLWTGITVCNQQEADEKIPVFLRVPGKKFLSIEPMLGPISLRWIAAWNGMATKPREFGQSTDEYDGLRTIDAVILGGETGPGARPMHPDWVRLVRKQCAVASVPFFFKRWGKHIPDFSDCFGKTEVSPLSALTANIGRLFDGQTHNDLPWMKSI